MSYHGALLGFLLGAYIFSKRTGNSFGKFMDLVAVAVPLGYIFGRIGNFLNQELVGRATDVPWGIYVDGVLRHPSQLYEAFLEGLVLFIILWHYSKKPRPTMATTGLAVFLYGCFRFFIEFFRMPDAHLGFVALDWVTMGQILSTPMIIIGGGLIYWAYKKETVK